MRVCVCVCHKGVLLIGTALYVGVCGIVGGLCCTCCVRLSQGGSGIEASAHSLQRTEVVIKD